MLFLARDRVGKKPLHYRFLPDGGLVFASEINALLEGADGALPLDALAVDDFFAYGYIPEPRSIYRDIRKIPAAHYLLQERGRAQAAQPRRYWHAAPILSAEPDAVSTLQLHLRRSVADRLTADVPLGAFLSGGVDSGAIVATAAGLRAAPLATFTIGFEGPEDERDLAAQVAARYATSHHAALAVFDPLEAARRQAALFGEPFGDMSSVPTEAVCALARRHVTVALSGDGGDEVLGGYRRYQWHMIAQAVRACIPSPLRRSVLGRLARAYPKLDRAPRWLRAKHTLTEMSLDSALGYYSTLCKAQFERRRGLFTPALTSRLDGYDPGARVVEIMAESDEADSLRQAQMVDLALYLPGDILTKVDRTSMAHGLEVRAPLLDTDFMQWGLGLPSALKMRGGQGKRVLKQAMAVQLPREILYRAKQGFAASPAGALRAAASTLRARLLGESMLDSGLFQRRGLDAVIEQHVTGGFDHSQILWSLLVFQGFLAGAARAPEAAQKFLNPVLSGS
jgi:asparagine synthase (glutamine-hydrolysing)